jgi:hypothetical protein
MTMRFPWFPVAVALLAFSMMTGCMCLNQNIQHLPEPQPVVAAPVAVNEYWGDRWNDFLDLFRLQWGVPRDFKGLGAKVKVSCFEAGLVWFQGKKVGMERRAIGIIRQDKVEGGITPIYQCAIAEEPECGNYFMNPYTRWAQVRDRRIIRNGLFWSDGSKRPASVGFEFEFSCFGGPDVKFYCCELGDFIAGWFGIDPRGDDLSLLDNAERDNQFFNRPKPEEPALTKF